MAASDPVSQFEREIEYRVTSELKEMLETAQDWIDSDIEDCLDHQDELIFVDYRNALLDELAERDLDIPTGDEL